MEEINPFQDPYSQGGIVLLKKKELNKTLKDLNEVLLKPSNHLQAPIQLKTQLPLEKILPQPIISSALTPTEQNIYLHLAIELQIIFSKASSYQEGLYRWSLLLDDRLLCYGLTRNAWDDIAKRGNQDKQLETQLHILFQKIITILEKYKEYSIQMDTLNRVSSLRSFLLSDFTNAVIDHFVIFLVDGFI